MQALCLTAVASALCLGDLRLQVPIIASGMQSIGVTGRCRVFTGPDRCYCECRNSVKQVAPTIGFNRVFLR